MKIESICNQVFKNLKERGIEKPIYTKKQDYNTFKFTLKDPITNEILKEYSMIESEFLKLEFNKKVILRRMKKTENFDEESYLKEVQRQEKLKEKYNKEFNKEYKSIIKEKGITEKNEKLYSDIMDTVFTYFDFDDFSDREKTKLEFEDEILSDILRNKN